tara:strand:- start:12905 stop:13120 length:216 start_codon:yes stop_codon:yes gene_type:complete
MKIKIFNTIINNFKQVNDLLITLFIFAVISGLLFRDPFGVIESIGNMISNINDNGISALIALLVVVLWYRR